jgi:hypothetical protein
MGAMKPWLETWDPLSDDLDAFPFHQRFDEEAKYYIRTEPDLAWVQRLRLAAAAPALVRALLSVEWIDRVERNEGWIECPACKGGALFTPTGGLGVHTPACPVDAALTAAGLPDQASRNAARADIAAR